MSVILIAAIRVTIRVTIYILEEQTSSQLVESS